MPTGRAEPCYSQTKPTSHQVQFFPPDRDATRSTTAIDPVVVNNMAAEKQKQRKRPDGEGEKKANKAKHGKVKKDKGDKDRVEARASKVKTPKVKEPAFSLLADDKVVDATLSSLFVSRVCPVAHIKYSGSY